MNKQIHIFGGGTFSWVRSHLALAAPAFGETAKWIYQICLDHPFNRVRIPTPSAPGWKEGLKLDVISHLTAMVPRTNPTGEGPLYGKGGDRSLLTVEDLAERIKKVTDNPLTKIIFMSAAVVDFKGSILSPDGKDTPSGKYESRLKSRAGKHQMELTLENKIIASIREKRKDIFLVGFKTTTGESKQAQFEQGLALCKQASCNLVLANDTKTRWNMIITPEEAAYHQTSDRPEVLQNLVEMAILRSHLTFTRSTVVSGTPIPWNSELVPAALRTVVDHCIALGAYKPFNGATVGHFAVKIASNEFLTSMRKTNFNDLPTIGLVKVTTDGPDSVFAYGAKPSVGGQSQRIVFDEHPEYDCIVHFHCPLKEGHDDIPIRSQREVECGSHECGKNTSSGLKKFGNLSAVMLDQHGPNIVFNKNINPQEVINFIERNFDLSKKTGGYQL